MICLLTGIGWLHKGHPERLYKEMIKKKKKAWFCGSRDMNADACSSPYWPGDLGKVASILHASVSSLVEWRYLMVPKT